jgi:segregation and condensation protein B
VRIAGRKEVPGRPLIYETTPGFLELFGLKNLDALPDLEEFRAIEGAFADALDSPEQAQAIAPQETTEGLSPPTIDVDAETSAEPSAEPVSSDEMDESTHDSTDARVVDPKS